MEQWKGIWTQDLLAFCSWQTNRSILLWFWTSYTYQEALTSCDSWWNYCMCSLKEFPWSFFACRVGGLGKMGWLLGDGPGPCAVFIELSMAFCPEKHHGKPIFPKATPDERLCRAIHCLGVRRSKTVNTLLLLREKLKACISAGLQRALYQSWKHYEVVAMVLLRHSFCGALKWIYQVHCVHSKDLVHGTAVLQWVLLARWAPPCTVGSMWMHTHVLL